MTLILVKSQCFDQQQLTVESYIPSQASKGVYTMVHSLSLYGRPLPKPGELPVVKCIKVPERDLSGLLASKEFEAFGYVQELYWDRSANYVRWIRELFRDLSR